MRHDVARWHSRRTVRRTVLLTTQETHSIEYVRAMTLALFFLNGSFETFDFSVLISSFQKYFDVAFDSPFQFLLGKIEIV